MGARASSKELAWPALHQRSLQVWLGTTLPHSYVQLPELDPGHDWQKGSTKMCTLLLYRYIPVGVCAEELAKIERWRCDSRTAACACLLLLCATRETLTQGVEALQLAKALTEVCSALGRHSGQDSMAWGCDLDPGNLGTHMSALAGKTLCPLTFAL